VDASRAADLDLACRCAAGEPAAWDRFVREYRPVLYRAADALEPNGGARDLADSLYAELYGITGKDGARASLLRSFQGRSSLATWLRAVLTQRYVDRLRVQRRLEPLPVEERADAREPADPERERYLSLVQDALRCALAALDGKDRLRLAYYYLHQLTLAQIGRLLNEHEGTASRQLTRARQTVRGAIERELRERHGLTHAQIAECLASVTADPGPLDLTPMLGVSPGNPASPERSV
jgi:RNA polymerase sigma-70 factor (ECF subfamily)